MWDPACLRVRDMLELMKQPVPSHSHTQMLPGSDKSGYYHPWLTLVKLPPAVYGHTGLAFTLSDIELLDMLSLRHWLCSTYLSSAATCSGRLFLLFSQISPHTAERGSLLACCFRTQQLSFNILIRTVRTSLVFSIFQKNVSFLSRTHIPWKQGQSVFSTYDSS